MSLNRYKFYEKDFPNAKKYIKHGTGIAPNWCKKFKDKLTVKKSKIYFDKKEIIPIEKIDDYLRDKLYSKDATLPFGRDSAHYKLLQTCVGIPRRKLMEFLRSQKTLAESRPSLAKPKVKSGKKLKKLQIETDLIFVRRNDLIKANPKFENESLKNETYIITSVEVSSGLVQLDYLQNKTQTNAALEKHIKWFANKFNVNPSQFAIRSDAGSEYSLKRIQKLCPDYKFVASAASCERKNRQVQANLFRLLKNRQATSVKEAVQKSQDMCNNTLSRKHKKTPLETVEEEKNSDIIKKHNTTRKSYVKGDNRGDFKVGDHVRIMAPEKKRRSIEYKTYKGVTFEKQVRVITHTTKKAKPKKYRVSGKWYTQDRLIKASPVDKKSTELIKTRDQEEEKKDVQMRKEHLESQEALDIVKEADKKAGKKTTRKKGKFVKWLQNLRAEDEENLKVIEAMEKQSKKRKLPKGAKKRKKKEDEEWTP